MTLHHTIKQKLSNFKQDESGATAIEYGLFAALIGAVIVAAIAGLGTTLGLGFEGVEGALRDGFADADIVIADPYAN
ncbi:Flp family type IVb pilin [Pseudooceanicola sp. 200-1SW]|uniref:Flp family type IVb pilin n=1 Tax=Pseudooceanicola sp. 200-1SW TaxID=3425949 RepID=UPI003D7F4054